MPVNSTQSQYDEYFLLWSRIRDVLAGDQAIKRAGAKYVPRLDSQTDAEFDAYIQRSFFYNATARTVSGYTGMIFRKDPILDIPAGTPLREVFDSFTNDVDLRGTTLDSYAKSVVTEVVSFGRVGNLIDWHGEPENRAYLSMYPAEAILNWRQIRIDGHLRLSLVVLAESVPGEPKENDPFVVDDIQQIRVLQLVPRNGAYEFHVEIWQLLPSPRGKKEREWQLVQTMSQCGWANRSPAFRLFSMVHPIPGRISRNLLSKT